VRLLLDGGVVWLFVCLFLENYSFSFEFERNNSLVCWLVSLSFFLYSLYILSFLNFVLLRCFNLFTQFFFVVLSLLTDPCFSLMTLMDNIHGQLEKGSNPIYFVICFQRRLWLIKIKQIASFIVLMTRLKTNNKSDEDSECDSPHPVACAQQAVATAVFGMLRHLSLLASRGRLSHSTETEIQFIM
jgi:hypothetical protein